MSLAAVFGVSDPNGAQQIVACITPASSRVTDLETRVLQQIKRDLPAWLVPAKRHVIGAPPLLMLTCDP